jgi:pimeloyl-ACP methyl ester carboxylesterase
MAFEGFEEDFLGTKNGKVFYLHRKSQGRPMIFLHGIGGSSNTWNKIDKYLPKELDIYMIDMLGHGRSDAPDIEYDVMLQVGMLEEFVEKLSINDPLLFGHSYGGWMAIHYSLRHGVPDLMVEDCAGMESQQLEIIAAGKAEEDRDLLIKESIKIGAKEKVIRSAVDNFEKHMLTEELLSEVTARTLLIWGDDDASVPIKFGREMQALIKGSDFLTIPGAGHVPHRTKPEIVAKAIADFIADPQQG